MERRILQSRRRLAIALWFSTTLMVAAITLLPFELPQVNPLNNTDVLEVQIAGQTVEPEPVDAEPVEPEVKEPVQVPSEAAPVEDTMSEPEIETDVIPEDEPALVDDTLSVPPVDWYAVMQEVVRSDESGLRAPSMSAEFDERRRAARHQFRASKAVLPRKIWENVEKDMMGRTILRHGDCHRVLDDPNVGTQYVHRTFTQYLVFCTSPSLLPQELPFVDEITERYAYLRNDDSRDEDPVILMVKK